MKIISVVGARPNFMKIAPIVEALQIHMPDVEHRLLHTGQHYDAQMSKSFFEDLGIPKPDIDLGVGSGSHAEQTGRVMIEFEKVCEELQPDLVIVVGDVNSTLAAAITAKKLGIKVAHVEAGLRSRDMGMPEEINRLCTDALSDFLFTTDRIANDNLRAEGIAAERIHFVGNVMIDTLLKHSKAAAGLCLAEKWGLRPGGYALMTLHRPSNVDDQKTLEGVIRAVKSLAQKMPVIFPAHPRTVKMIQQFGLQSEFSTAQNPQGLWLTEPLGYLELLHLNMKAAMVLTDSGGLQEETTVLAVPCITLRDNTERPITCQEGTNHVAGNDPGAILTAIDDILGSTSQSKKIPEKWDGQAAKRIVEVLLANDALGAEGQQKQNA